ncbi:MAG: BlaI/MecI/CopY family transcriptional regulator [Clostridiales bacterium]|nr:BlaI/MecI/CopY family transcriptional regulator [Clostridiales bacterium]
MNELLLSESEYRLMDVIWKNAPVESGKLVKLCEAELNWKKSTTYTMLRRVMAKGMVRNDDSLVSVLIPRDRVQRFESERIVSKTFGGSLPSFLAAFLGDRTLSDSEADELIGLIDKYRQEN